VQFEEGQLIGSNLRLSRQLGEGGMGSVWVADHLTLHTQVAVKFISAALAADPEALGRFSREAAASARVKSPHIVQVFDHGVSEGLPYMVMELLEGEDLAALLERRGTLDPLETAQIVDQACKGLRQAHAAGIVHRDIKPGNIFLTAPGGERFVKLLDFGVAKAEGLETSTKTSAGSTVGTPFYMSPEQLLARGKPDARADLWSVAVVAYECMTGRLPFEGDTIAALGVAIYAGTFPLPSVLGQVRSPALDAWFTRAFARDVNARFATARELADALLAAATASVGAGAPARGAAYGAAYGGAPAASSISSTSIGGSPPRAPTVRAWQVVAGAAMAFALGGLGLLARQRAMRTDPPIESAASADATAATAVPAVSLAEPTVSAAAPVPSMEPSSPPAPGPGASSSPSRPASSTHSAAVSPATSSSASKSTKRRDHGF